MKPLPFAEDVNYWKTGRTAPDTKLDQAARLIEEVGGEVTHRAVGFMNGRSAIYLGFTIDGAAHQICWPVLETRNGERDTPPARIQAATFVYHDVKAKAATSKVIGPAAFADLRMIPSTQTTPREIAYDGDPQDLKLLT